MKKLIMLLLAVAFTSNICAKEKRDILQKEAGEIGIENSLIRVS